jgi:23S rRNA pseudouridine2605 synthase
MMYFDGEKNKRKKKADFKKVEEMPAPKKKPLKKGGAVKPMERPISTKAEGTMRLNRYIAHCGICSRRKADDYIVEGKVKVNNKVVKEPGTLWQTGDVVLLEGKKIETQKFVYILLNKPKNTISTNSDEKGRKTVFDFIQDSLEAKNLGHLRLFSIGRLDRNSMGVLLLTNDGELNQELSHPSKEVEKIYQVQLDKEVKQSDIEALANGVELEDGPIHCDTIAYVHELAKDEVGVEIHSGKNRIVRRMFEHLGYTVIKLDRVSYAGLTKKNLPRGKWRFLTDNEIRRLKYFDKTKKARSTAQKKS